MNELDELLKTINEIQVRSWLGISPEDKAVWRTCHRRMSQLGYKTYWSKAVGKWRMKAKPAVLGQWKVDEHEKNHNSECTTRALFYCLNHAVSYQTIRETQNARARARYHRGRCYGWNTREIWGGILTEHGFKIVKLPVYHKYTFGGLAEKLKGIDTRIVLHTRGHVAVAHLGYVVDDWDSRAKNADFMYVKVDAVDAVLLALGLTA